ncbi:MAG: thiamine biosynthesis protein ThiS [Thaumarchaeota archaeon]|nr:thiamine biosynthesis protein ThiS [Nitrososphaerota archaeon]
MIIVKLFGGAKKTFSTDQIIVNQDNLTIKELLDFLAKTKPKNTNELDTNNLLVAINGVDSSTIGGFSAKLKANDVVSIIPIIHGGSTRIQFLIYNKTVEIFAIKKQNPNIEFLDKLREKFPNIIIQGISSNFILGPSHVKKIILLSLYAKKNNILLSKKLETDIIMRFAGTNQIIQAIKIVGVRNNEDFIIVAIGKKLLLDRLYDYLKSFLTTLPKNNQSFLKKQFNISSKHLDAASSKTPLEDLLTERAAVLFR